MDTSNLCEENTIEQLINQRQYETIAFGTGSTIRRLMGAIKPLPNKTLLTLGFSNEIKQLDNELKECLKKVDVFIEEVTMVKTREECFFIKNGSFLASKVFYEMASSRMLFLVDLVVEKENNINRNEIYVPVEIVKEAYFYIKSKIKNELNLKIFLKMQESHPYITENKNYILNVQYVKHKIEEVKKIVGVVDIGIFKQKSNTKIINLVNNKSKVGN
ncbi:rpiA [Ecytonucleospora hepatopenaei]|uniref:RpiA n=1 Tax=Ecytonucleospora hepatopenaei TaxID=646526 RepID=A0A1W0E4F9_9MICR|nr:rpiA [Ecytonucleospora hepatopenaei]